MAKTLRSRIAAVAVAAVGVAVLQAAPAFANTSATPFEVSNAESTSGNGTATVAATQIAGANNFVSLGFVDGDGYEAAFSDNVRSGFLTITGGTFSSVGLDNVTLDAAKTTAQITDADDDTNVNVLTPSAGTITVKFIVRSWTAGQATDATKQTITITVGTATVGVYGSTKVFIAADDDDDAVEEDAEAADLVFAKAADLDTPVARLRIDQYDKQATPEILTDADAKAVTVSISGAGAIGAEDDASQGSYLAWAAGDESELNVYIYADGRAGVGTLTVSVNGVAVSTKTVKFYGDVATLTATQLKYSLSDGDGSTAYVKITAKDSAGIAVPIAAAAGAPVETAAALVVTAVTDADNAGAVNVAIDPTATKTGTKTITWKHTDTGVTVSTSVVVSGLVDSATVTTDKATYAPGEAIKVSVTAKDSAGNIAVDGETDAASVAVTTSTFQNATLPTTLTFKNGVATFSIYAPGTTGDFKVNVKFADGDDWSDNMDDVTKTVTVKVAADTTAIDAVKADVAKLTTTITTIQTAISTLVASTTATLTVLGSQIAKIMKKLGIK